jgi:hypothetical protein
MSTKNDRNGGDSLSDGGNNTFTIGKVSAPKDLQT